MFRSFPAGRNVGCAVPVADCGRRLGGGGMQGVAVRRPAPAILAGSTRNGRRRHHSGGQWRQLGADHAGLSGVHAKDGRHQSLFAIVSHFTGRQSE